MKELRLKLRDYILIGAVLFFCILPTLWLRYVDVSGKEVVYLSIQVQGKEVQKVPLSDKMETMVIPLEQNGKVKNVVQIKDGFVDMLEADCPDQLCDVHKPISESGESIVCLPNKVVLEIIGRDGNKSTEGDMNTY